MAADTTERLLDAKTTGEFQKEKEAADRVLADALPMSTEKPITEHAEAARVADTINALSHVRKDIDAARLKATEPYRATTDGINADYNELRSRIEAAERALKDKGLAWQRAEEARAEEERRRRQAEIDAEAEAKAKEAQEAAELAEQAAKETEDEKEQEEMQQLADEAREEAAAAAVAPPAQAAPTPRQTRGSVGKLGTRKVYKFDIEDAEKVPEKFKVVSGDIVKGAIMAEAKASKREKRPFSLTIEGIRIYVDDVAVSR